MVQDPDRTNVSKEPVPRERRQLGAGAIATIVGVAVLILFMAQNAEHVPLDFLFWTFTWPLWFLTLFSAVFGAIVWFGLGVMRRHRRRTERRLERKGR